MIINLDDYFSQSDKWLYDQLKNIRQDVFPDEFKLIVNYTSDRYNNSDSPGIAISKLQQILALLDFPNFFVTVATTNQQIKKDLEKIKNLYCPYENILSYNVIDGEFKKIIQTGNSRCVLPWIHLYVNPQGLVGTCCEFNESFPLGKLSESNLQEIANSDAIKTVRKQMMSGQRPNICSACWDKEDAHISSQRTAMNHKFSHYLPLIDQTTQDGSFENFKLRHLDFRASNICNLKCRMCSGKFSSRIAKEENDLYNNSTFVDLKLNSAEINSTLNYIEENIDHLESVYFAGGEPLIMEEHYKILDLLIQHNKLDIEINYNTNLTQLTYKKRNIVDYWNKFSNVTVGASIDLMGPQADYFRSGTKYNELEKNYEAIKDCVSFRISSIVHLCNVFNLPKLQRHWITNKKMSPEKISFRALIYPENMSLQVLPPAYKIRAAETITNHINWLCSISDTESLVSAWQNVLQYMNAKDQSHLLKEFFRLNDDKDRIRDEQFEDVFPEYQDLRSYVQNQTPNS
jgi:radical SAM protein with 4Fe4S-binding SPASM domain